MSSQRTALQPAKRMFTTFNRLFPLWAIILSAVAVTWSNLFTPLESAIVPLLSMIMLCMGMTTGLDDFLRIARRPLPIALGVALQFVIMPVLALTLSAMLQLSNQLTIGMVLVGSCAGGTASNVICYLARGDVALSISLTLCSTLAGVVLTPLLTSFFLSATVAVDTLQLLISILQMVLVPVTVGVLLKQFLPALTGKLEPAVPTLSICLILLIIAIVVALNSGRFSEIGPAILLAVVMHNLLGLGGGYTVSRLFGLDTRQSQTIAIEVGMQNSGLGVALALQFFSATAALPGALFSIWHNISGSLVASYWGRKRESLEYLLRDEDRPATEK